MDGQIPDLDLAVVSSDRAGGAGEDSEEGAAPHKHPPHPPRNVVDWRGWLSPDSACVTLPIYRVGVPLYHPIYREGGSGTSGRWECLSWGTGIAILGRKDGETASESKDRRRLPVLAFAALYSSVLGSPGPPYPTPPFFTLDCSDLRGTAREYVALYGVRWSRCGPCPPHPSLTLPSLPSLPWG